MCEIHVSGCQFAASNVVNAQPNPVERNAAIHHWIFLDICRVIESDELMPDYLRVNPKRHYRQTEQDDQIGRQSYILRSPERHFRLFRRCGKSRFSFPCLPFGHAGREATRDGQPK